MTQHATVCEAAEPQRASSVAATTENVFKNEGKDRRGALGDTD